MLKRALVLALMALSGSAEAQNKDLWSGNALLPGCKQVVAYEDGRTVPKGADGAIVDGGICMGLFSALAYYGGWMDPTHKFCAPDGVTQTQLMRVAIKYLDDHPEYMHVDLRASALVAMTKAFPCKR